MTAEEVALEEFRRAAHTARTFAQALRVDPESWTLRAALAMERDSIHRLARIIRAIRAERRGDQLRASYEASVSEMVIHAESAWYARGREEALRGVACALYFASGEISTNFGPRPSDIDCGERFGYEVAAMKILEAMR